MHTSPPSVPRKRVLAYFLWSMPALWHGVRAYSREAGWILVSPNHVHGPPNSAAHLAFDGVLLLVGSHEVFDTRKVWPNAMIVDMQNTPGLSFDASVTLDHDGVGRMAADYLYDIGYRKFVGLSHNVKIHTLVRQINGFETRLRELGLKLHHVDSNLWMPAPDQLLEEMQKVITRAGLPLAVFSPNDNMADLFMQASLELGYRIPEDIAILGSNNDRAFCEMCRVPLSSIDMNYSRLGYESARLLDRLMNKDSTAPKLVATPPSMVETRLSTQKMQTTDRIVRTILEYIGEHFAEKITAEHIIHDIHASRSAAFDRFRKVMGRSIGKELERVRLDHAKTLLKETDYKLDAVARLCGYLNTSAFCRAFKTAIGETPSDYRHNA